MWQVTEKCYDIVDCMTRFNTFDYSFDDILPRNAIITSKVGNFNFMTSLQGLGGPSMSPGKVIKQWCILAFLT